MKNIEKLKPCPFCGNDNPFILNPHLKRLDDINIGLRSEVICDGCGVGVGFGYGYKTDEEARTAAAKGWNKRAYIESDKSNGKK